MEEETESKPAEIVLGPEYDASDEYHVRLWELAGKPPLNDGSNWRPTVTMLLQPDGETYERMTLPLAQNVTDVEKSTTNFSTAEELAAKYLNALKGKVVVYLKTKRTEPEAVAAGVAFVDPDTGIGKEYDYFIKAGGHPLAAAKLYQRIQEVKGSFDWFDDQVNAIFTAALTK